MYMQCFLFFKETKSCIDIDGSCMLMNLQPRREGVESDKCSAALVHSCVQYIRGVQTDPAHILYACMHAHFNVESVTH